MQSFNVAPPRETRLFRMLTTLMLLFALLPSAARPTQVEAAACPANGVRVIDNVSGDGTTLTFYEDTSSGLRGMYVGYTITNSAATTSPDVWVKLDSFTGGGGRIQLASTEDGVQHVGPLAAGASVQVYFYLGDATGSTDNNALNETFQINIYNGDPTLVSEVCDYTDTINAVENTISANANVVNTTISGPNPAQLGGVMTMSVVGETGTVGAAQVFGLSPAAALSWNAGAYQMTDVQVDYYYSTANISCPDKNGGVPTVAGAITLQTINDKLYFITPTDKSACYKVTYSFIAVGTTSGPTAVSATNYISSGTQIKHSSPSGTLANFPGVSPASNTTTLGKSASPTILPTGGAANYTVTLSNAGSAAVTLDSIRDSLPTGASYATGTSSSTCTSTAVGNPLISGQVLTWSGLFVVPAKVGAVNGTCTLTYQTTIPNTVGSYTNSVSGKIGSTQIDTTLSTTDNAPATAAVVVGNPALSLTKTDGGASVSPGNNVIYTLDYQNTGNTTLTNVTLNETVPANTTFNAASSTTGWTCANGSVAGTVCTLNVSTVTAGGTGSATFAVTVISIVPDGTTQISNNASVSSGATTASSSDTTPLNTNPALTLTKSDGGASVAPGGTVVYTLGYQNTGNIGLTGVTLSETVPPNTTFTTTGSSTGWSCPNNSAAGTVCTLTIGALPTATLGSAAFAVNVVTPVAAGTVQVSNTASASADGGTTTNATDTTPVNSSPALSLTKSDNGVSVAPGGTITYQLDYANTGNIGLTGVVLSETVPANTTFTSAGSTGGWSCADGSAAGTPCTLTIGNLAAGASGSATFVVTVANTVAAGTAQISNSATVASGATTASGSDTTPLITTPGLTLAKSDGGTSAVPGDTIAYTLDYANTGNIGMTGVVLRETVPANTTFNAASSTGVWSCANGAAAGTVCTLTVGLLAVATNGSRTFAVTVINPVAANTTQITNNASISNGTTTATNSDFTPLATAPAVTLTKSDGGASVAPGGTVAYSLNYANTGNINLAGVTLTEAVPANTTFNAAASSVGWSCADGSAAGTPCTLTLGMVAGGASGSKTFAVTVVTPVLAGTTQLTNSASVGDGTTTASANDTTPVTTSPAMTLAKTDGGASVAPGGTAAYSLNYANTGNIGLAGVTLAETVPVNTTFNAAASSVGWSCADGSAAGTTCTLTLGAFAGGTSGSRTFAVTVSNPLPAGATQLTNSASVGNGTTSANGSDTTPLLTSPALSLLKSDNGASTVPGGIVVYTLDYVNTGNIGLTGVTLSETVPANTTFDAANSGGWSCANGAAAGTTCTLTIGSLAAGANGSVAFAVTVLNTVPAGTTGLANTATASATGGTSASGSDTTPLNPTPGLTLGKSDGNATVVPGGTVAYTLSYGNSGNIGLANLILSETVPANTTFNSAMSSVGWSCPNDSVAGTVCTYNVGSLGAGIGGAATFAVKVAATLPAGTTQVANSATISDGTTSRTNSDVTPITTTPGLSLAKSDNSASVAPGGTVVYTLSYANTGNIGLTGVVLRETVPANTTFSVAGSSPGWSCANGAAAGTACTLAVGNLPVGATGTPTFAVTAVTPAPAGVSQLTNSAQIDDGQTSASANDTTPLTLNPALTLSKSDNGSTATPGSVVIYTLNYANGGNVDLTGVVVSETVPANSTFDAANSAAGWSCLDGAAAGTVCTLPIGNLAGGASGATTFAVNVLSVVPAGMSQLANSASVSASGGTSANASDTTPVSSTPGLSLTKSDNGATATPGGTISYQLGYANTGNINLTAVTLSETVPANTTFNAGASVGSWSCPDTSPAGTVCTLSIGALAGGGSGSVVFAVNVVASLPVGVTQVSNSATVSDSSTQATATDTTPLNINSALSLTKSDGNISAAPGQTIPYNLGYANTGNIGLTGIVLSETVPANTTFNSAASSVGWSCANGAVAGTICTLAVGTLPANGTGSAIFAVTVVASLLTGAMQISNAATITASGGATASNSDTTPLNATPGLSLSKNSTSAVVSPGDLIIYTLDYGNTGNIGLNGVTLKETVPANTTFVAASSTSGWSCANGAPVGTTCTFAIGSLAAGVNGTVSFAVQVVNPIAEGQELVANLAVIDEPGGTTNSSGKTIPVETNPGLSLTKQANSASTAPGSTVVYTLNYANTGDVGLSSVVLSEVVPNNTTYSASGSSVGWNCADGSGAGTTCTLNIGSLAGGAAGSATFVVQVLNPLAPDGTQIDNTASVFAGETTANGSASTPVVAAPILVLDKTVADINGGELRPGDVIEYTLTVRNTGTIAAADVTITDNVPANTSYVVGSTTINGAPMGDVNGQMPFIAGGIVNSPGAPGGQVNVGSNAVATFRVVIINPLPSNVTGITNQATVQAARVQAIQSNDPNTVAGKDPTVALLGNPTAITLSRFTATRVAQGVSVNWTTSAEVGTRGFALFRATTGQRAQAERITPTLIASKGGAAAGATYSWQDTTALPGVAYSYWLQEIENDNSVNEYGPVSVFAGIASPQQRIFIPLVGR